MGRTLASRHGRSARCATAIALLLGAAVSARASTLGEHLRSHGLAPVEYVLAKAGAHRIVILGEAHWQRPDAELVASLVPELRSRRVALALEVLPAALQADIDALLAAPEWRPAAANRILAAADWPYLQYRDILQRTWEANREPGTPLRVVALGPPANWREQGLSYDDFLAERLQHVVEAEKLRVVAYVGMHHAFTRYLQVERFTDGRATELMQRMGNVLWRRYGADVFLVALHKPDPCGPPGNAFAVYCAPFDGAVDCAALEAGGHPVGFDLLGSPLAERRFPESSYYAAGHPLLRAIDYADGWLWQRGVDETVMVDVIPVVEFAPEDLDDPEALAEWRRHADDLAHPEARPSRRQLADWRLACPAARTDVTASAAAAGATAPRPPAASPCQIGAVSAVVVRLERAAHEGLLPNTGDPVANVLSLAIIGPGEGRLPTMLQVGVVGHPRVEGRPLLLGDVLGVVLPCDWENRDLALEELEGLRLVAD